MRWWPWVSRERLEEKQAEIAELKQELRAVLYGGPLPERTNAPADPIPELAALLARTPMAPAEPRERDENEGAQEPFTTPFDRLEQNCGRALATGRIDRKFRARV